MIKELQERLSTIIRIDSFNINKLYEELLSFFSESPKEYILRRYKELKIKKYKNERIYEIISNELPLRLFKGDKLTNRQIKRIIYKE